MCVRTTSQLPAHATHMQPLACNQEQRCMLCYTWPQHWAHKPTPLAGYKCSNVCHAVQRPHRHIMLMIRLVSTPGSEQRMFKARFTTMEIANPSTQLTACLSRGDNAKPCCAQPRSTVLKLLAQGSQLSMPSDRALLIVADISGCRMSGVSQV